jgi:hypothetical protein
MASNSTDNIDTERLRIQLAFWLACIGLALAAALAVLLVSREEMKVSTSAEVVAIVGLFTSVTGTIVGAFFGVQIGAAGTEHERRSRQKAEEVTRRALAHMHPDAAKAVVGDLPERQ